MKQKTGYQNWKKKGRLVICLSDALISKLFLGLSDAKNMFWDHFYI